MIIDLDVPLFWQGSEHNDHGAPSEDEDQGVVELRETFNLEASEKSPEPVLDLFVIRILIE